MNKTNRNRIEKTASLLEDYRVKIEAIRSEVEGFKDAEEEAYENLSEKAQEGDKGVAIDEAKDTLENCFSELETVDSALEDAINNLNSIVENY